MLTSRERLRRCFFHEELDRPGVFCRTGYPKDDPSYQPLHRLLAERSDLKVSWNAAGELVEPMPLERRVEAYSEAFDLETLTLPTPAGDLTATRFLGRQGQPGMVEKHFLSDRADAERFLSMPMPRVGGDVSAAFALDRQVGARGIVDVSLGMNVAGQVAELFGSEAFAIMTITERDVVHALCRRQVETMLALAEALLDAGAGPYFSTLGQEYVAPPLHGRCDFFDFNVQYDKPVFDRLHERGGRVHVHCHGSIRTVFDGFLEAGVDVLHPFEAPPMGDITAADAKAAARGRICLEGNIQIADMYERSPEEIRAQTRQLIATCFDDRRGLILCPSASPWIAGDGLRCLPQFEAMIEEVERVRQST